MEVTSNGITILCAEDEPELREDIVGELRDAGYQVIEAVNGEDALMAITTFMPDIVLCDINMPRMNGLEVLEHVRASETEAADVPFIFLTAYGEKSDLIKGRKLGADDYLVKPIDFDLLLATVAARMDSNFRAKRRVTSRAQQLERDLSKVLATGATSTSLPNADELHAILAQDNLPDSMLVLASMDAYHRLTPQFGSQSARQLLERYLSAFRASSGDIPAHVYQLENDVFALLVEGSHQWEEIARNAGGLVDTTLEVTGIRLPVTSTVVIAEYRSGDARSPAQLLDDALLALRFARRDGGRNLVRVDDPVRDRLRIMQFIEDNIGKAIANNELFLAFQPKISFADRGVVGAEALIRWQSAERGLISPGLFIPIIEKTGFVDRISDWVLDHAARSARQLQDAGLPTKIAVNASGAELHSHFVSRVETALTAHQVAPTSLEVEITETSVILDMDFAASVTEKLRRQGVSVVVDDFGTGYSSLSYLRTFPLDGVKIDQSFVRGITTNAIDRQIVESVVGLARAIGLKTVAEGVETQEQFDLLNSIGCDVAQGYLIAKPLVMDDLMKFIRS
ncbi:EAL domain-containing response regulator [Dongia rigui]|uniref:EAL domain-containing protein n=1 Tax=Dongia rigui TaxID=940149 RepID=A0ABU5DUG7_9PROT|nr:EAL domain-containing protein [Dongia rigui]MDY0870956.1 EAL domain-containing protein [Dongia rigui]